MKKPQKGVSGINTNTHISPWQGKEYVGIENKKSMREKPGNNT